MGAPMEAHPDFVFSNGDLRRHIDQIAEDLARLCIAVPTHTASHDAIETACQNQERHVEIHLHADRRGERVDMEEAYRVSESIFYEHPLGVAQDQLACRGFSVICQ